MDKKVTQNKVAQKNAAQSGVAQTTDSHATAGNATAFSRSYYVFLIIFLVGLSAFGSFVNDMYIPAFPEMKHAFRCSVTTVQLGLTFGMVGLSVGQLILGPMSDRLGRRPTLMVALILFIIGAVGSVFSPSIGVFLCWRLLQGLGASAGYFLARTIPADIYGGRRLAQMMALIGAINGFAPASAPVIGGLVATAWTWKGIFWLLGGIALALFCLTFFFKESLPAQRRSSGPLFGAFKEYGPLLGNRRFMVHVLLKGTALGVLFAYISSSPFIMQTIYGFSELKFGLFMGFNAIFAAVGSIMAVKFKILKRAAWIGGWVLLMATVVESLALFFIDDFWAYEMALLPMLFALGMIFTVGNTLAMNEGRQNAGAASAILGVTGYVFGAIVSPLVGLGDIRYSTAIVFLVMAVQVLLYAYGSRRIPADLDKN